MVHWGRMIPAYGTIQALSGVSGHKPRVTDKRGVTLAAERLAYPVACIWAPSDDGVGHASVFIQRPDGASPPEDDTSCYASLFPGDDTKTGESGANGEHLLPGRMLSGSAQTFAEDCKSERGKGAGYRLPDHMIPLRGLDRLKMQAAWNAIRDKPGMHYRLLRKNCSTIAARVIRAGMGTKQLALSPLLTHKAWWTPYDVLLLAESLAD